MKQAVWNKVLVSDYKYNKAEICKESSLLTIVLFYGMNWNKMASLFSIAILSINNKNQILPITGPKFIIHRQTGHAWGHLANVRCAAQINKIVMNNEPSW